MLLVIREASLVLVSITTISGSPPTTETNTSWPPAAEPHAVKKSAIKSAAAKARGPDARPDTGTVVMYLIPITERPYNTYKTLVYLSPGSIIKFIRFLDYS